MIELTPEQMAQLDRLALSNFRSRVTQFMINMFPRHAKIYGSEHVRRAAEEGFAKALELRVTSERGLTTACVLTLLAGRGIWACPEVDAYVRAAGDDSDLAIRLLLRDSLHKNS